MFQDIQNILFESSSGQPFCKLHLYQLKVIFLLQFLFSYQIADSIYLLLILFVRVIYPRKILKQKKDTCLLGLREGVIKLAEASLFSICRNDKCKFSLSLTATCFDSIRPNLLGQPYNNRLRIAFYLPTFYHSQCMSLQYSQNNIHSQLRVVQQYNWQSGAIERKFIYYLVGIQEKQGSQGNRHSPVENLVSSDTLPL